MGNVYMRADQISYKDGTVKDALDNGGGGGGSSSAADVSYDNTSSGLTATNVQAAIDEVAGDLSGLEGDLSGLEDTVSALDGKIDALPLNVYSETEAVVGKWGDDDLYRKVINIGALPNNTLKSFTVNITTETVRRIELYYTSSSEYGPVPNNESTMSFNKSTKKLDVATSGDYSGFTGVVILEYTKA